MRTAVLFPGQGSQSVGMLSKILAGSRRAGETVAAAGRILGYDIGRLIAKGPLEELTRTEHAQPAIVLASLCEWEAALERDPQLGRLDVVMAGHSIGEYSALAAAGYFSLEQILELASLRGRLMAECIRETGPRSGMAVVVLTDPKHLPVLVSEIDAAADGRPVAIAAINSSLQITLSGEEGEVERLMSLARAQRGVAAVQRMRRVAGAFHSPLMREAQRRFAVEASPLLRRARPSAIPVISNVTAEPHTAAGLEGLLCRQIVGRVRWHDTVCRLVSHGCTRVLPIGPGDVLAALINADPTTKNTLRIG